MGPSSALAADDDVFKPLTTDFESTFPRVAAAALLGLLALLPALPPASLESGPLVFAG